LGRLYGDRSKFTDNSNANDYANDDSNNNDSNYKNERHQYSGEKPHVNVHSYETTSTADTYEEAHHFDSCRLRTFQRLRPFAGQLLVPEDFSCDQDYFNEKRHLINRTVNGTGIVCGLQLTVLSSSSDNLIVRLSRGLAIDCCGKEIVVSKTRDHKIQLDRFSDSELNRLGLFITRCDVLRSPVSSIAMTSDICSDGETYCCESRVEEGYKLILKPIDVCHTMLKFDKVEYCVNDRVRIEAWLPNGDVYAEKTESDQESENKKEAGNTISYESTNNDDKEESNINGVDNDSVEINVSSSSDSDGITVHLKRIEDSAGRKTRNIYRGEIVLVTRPDASNEGFKKLLVKTPDTIIAKYGNGLQATAYVTSSSSSFIASEMDIINQYFKNRLSDCPGCNDDYRHYHKQDYASYSRDGTTMAKQNGLVHGVLLAVFKANGMQEYATPDNNYSSYNGDKSYEALVYIDEQETSMCRKYVYNNPMLYELFREKVRCFEERPQHFTRCIILSGQIEITISDLKSSCYKIVGPFNFFEAQKDTQYTSKSLVLKPVIYLGRMHEDRDRVVYYEDFDFEYCFNFKKYKANSQKDAKIINEIDLCLPRNISFKPILAKNDGSFYIMVSKGADRENKTQKITLIWWAFLSVKEF
jgi:hypothetical protein